jgi:hypothetical protein
MLIVIRNDGRGAHLLVTIAGAPRLNVGLSEVGLKEPESRTAGVGGGT